ncbi:MAG TPA: class I SAM-dependent methyltransferase [Bacteroidia bacterium]|jgi:cephalosporin hydroxylase|nr:class I SAM-dependent methyltransferase [Bacteroidia bacterium]
MLKNFLKKTTYKDPALNPHSTEFEVNNWIISEYIVNRLVPVVGIHPFPLDELMLMTSAVCRFKPQYIFEWGTNIGKSARIFYEITNAFKIDCEIHSIDLPDDVYHNEHPQKNRGKMVRGIDSVKLHQADGLVRSVEIYREKKPDGNVLFFLDGDHSYETVKKELETILGHIPGAVLLLHDTFYQSENSGYNIGPVKAINEVVNKNMYNVISTNTGLPGMSLVFKK